jgi:hypothetical protein
LIHPSVFANIFVLLALLNLLDIYRSEESLSKIFNAGVYTTMAIFFYFNYVFFMLLFFIALVILRSFNWREWVIGILGLVSPVLIYVAICYLTGTESRFFFENLVQLLTWFEIPILSEYFYLLFVTLIMFVILTIFFHLSRGLGGKVKTQKTLGLIYWFLALSLVNFFAKRNYLFFPALASIIPLSILLGDYFYNIKQLKIANTLFIMLLAAGSVLYLVHLKIL